MQWYLQVLKKYAVFDGRASRREFWFFAFYNIIAAAVMGLIAVKGMQYGYDGLTPLPLVYVLATLIPAISVMVRRLHDTGKSGWWFFVTFVPAIGHMWLFVLLVLESDRGANEYGPSPAIV